MKYSVCFCVIFILLFIPKTSVSQCLPKDTIVTCQSITIKVWKSVVSIYENDYLVYEFLSSHCVEVKSCTSKSIILITGKRTTFLKKRKSGWKETTIYEPSKPLIIDGPHSPDATGE